MDANDMSTIADMLRTIVKTEMDGHFERDGEGRPAPAVNEAESKSRRGRGRPLGTVAPETAWLDTMIERGRITTAGGTRSNYYKLYFIIKNVDIYPADHLAAYLGGDMERRKNGEMLDDEEWLLWENAEAEYTNYAKKFRRRRGKIQED